MTYRTRIKLSLVNFLFSCSNDVFTNQIQRSDDNTNKNIKTKIYKAISLSASPHISDRFSRTIPPQPTNPWKCKQRKFDEHLEMVFESNLEQT